MSAGSLLCKTLTVMLGVCAAQLANGQEGPYSIGINQTVGYQYNVFQVASDEPKTNDFVASTGLAFNVNQTVDIYTFLLNASAQTNTYQDTKVLNNPTYNLSAGLASNTERLAGAIRFVANQGLGDYATPNVAAITEKNIQNTEEIGLTLRYASTPRLDLGGGVAYQWNRFSAAAFESQESSQGAAFFDLGYRVTPVLQVGLGPRFTKGSTPKYATGAIPGMFIADDFDGRYLDLLAAWGLTADSGLRAGLSLTRVTHSVATQLDYTGLTGFVSWWYRLGGNLSLNVAIGQSTGLGALSGAPVTGGAPFARTGSSTTAVTGPGTTGAGGSQPSTSASGGAGAATASGTSGATGGSPSSTVNNNRLNRTASVGASYSLGSKTDATADLVLNNGYLADTDGATGNVRTAAFSLGIRFTPIPALSLACNVSLSRQNANQAAVASGQAHSFNASTTSCTAQYTLQ